MKGNSLRNKDISEILNSTLNIYLDYFREELLGGYKGGPVNKQGHFKFIPTRDSIGLLTILNSLCNRISKQNKRPTFLDAGCGIGNILFLARAVGFECTGIEYDEKTYKIANKLNKISPWFWYRSRTVYTKILKGDIVEFENYDKFDVIFFYLPINNVRKMEKFTNKVANEMSIGSFVIPIGKAKYFLKDKRFKRIMTFRSDNFDVWRKERK